MNDPQESILEVGMVLRGGIGEVYRAHQLNLKRNIALKVISREWLNKVSTRILKRSRARFSGSAGKSRPWLKFAIRTLSTSSTTGHYP